MLLMLFAGYLIVITIPNFGEGLDCAHTHIRYGWPIMMIRMCSLIYLGIYPWLPQALGGPQPRCAYVDLVRDELAPASLSLLASDPEGESPSKVVRSAKLRVYFSSDDHLLVRKAVDGFSDSKGDDTLFELRNTVIRVIRWCAS